MKHLITVMLGPYLLAYIEIEGGEIVTMDTPKFHVEAEKPQSLVVQVTHLEINEEAEHDERDRT